MLLTLHALAVAKVPVGEVEVEDLRRGFQFLLRRKRGMDGHSEVPPMGSAQIAQWNSTLDRIFIDAMVEHETSWAGSMFTLTGWHSIVRRFNEQSGLSYTKVQIQHRWKNMKKDYASYLYLRNKSGWGWDTIYNRPIPPSDDAWFELVDRYRKYRNKPFMYFGNIQRFLSKDIATDVHANSSRPTRDKQPMVPSSSRQASRQRELNFDENLDECMSYHSEDEEDSEDMTLTPSSRKRTIGNRTGSSKKSRSGGALLEAGQQLLEMFLTNLPKKFAEGRHDPDELVNEACREVSVFRPDLDIEQFERVAEKLATTSGRDVFYHVKGDPHKLNEWIEKTIRR